MTPIQITKPCPFCRGTGKCVEAVPLGGDVVFQLAPCALCEGRKVVWTERAAEVRLKQLGIWVDDPTQECPPNRRKPGKVTKGAPECSREAQNQIYRAKTENSPENIPGKAPGFDGGRVYRGTEK